MGFHLRLSLALLAWLAQLCLPIAHAAMMATPPAAMAGWCGDSARFLALVAEQPAEFADALDLEEPGKASPQQLADCAKLCATAATPALLPAMAPTVALRAAGLEPATALAAPPATREQSPTPPAQAPPARV